MAERRNSEELLKDIIETGQTRYKDETRLWKLSILPFKRVLYRVFWSQKEFFFSPSVLKEGTRGRREITPVPPLRVLMAEQFHRAGKLADKASAAGRGWISGDWRTEKKS